MDLICKICGKDMDPTHVQQGNCHFGCFNDQLTVYKIYLIDDSDEIRGNHYVEKDPQKIIGEIEALAESDDGQGIAIRVSTMSHGEYINLPDFEGF